MSYDDAEMILLGQLTRQLHHELTGEALQWSEMPCMEAITQAMDVLVEAANEVDRLVVCD